MSSHVCLFYWKPSGSDFFQYCLKIRLFQGTPYQFVEKALRRASIGWPDLNNLDHMRHGLPGISRNKELRAYPKEYPFGIDALLFKELYAPFSGNIFAPLGVRNGGLANFQHTCKLHLRPALGGLENAFVLGFKRSIRRITVRAGVFGHAALRRCWLAIAEKAKKIIFANCSQIHPAQVFQSAGQPFE